MVLLGSESGGFVRVAETLQDEIHNVHLCETLNDVFELAPLLKHLGKVFIRILVWHHHHFVQLAESNTPHLHRCVEVILRYGLPLV